MRFGAGPRPTAIFLPGFSLLAGRNAMMRARLLLPLVLLAALLGEAAAAVEAAHGMVVSAQRYASEVGVRILAQGGNAIDAAVAVGYALAVVDPCCGNIGRRVHDHPPEGRARH